MQAPSKRVRSYKEKEYPGLREDEILNAIFDPKNRPNPYPFFAKLLERPISWQKGGLSETGSYVVSSYRDVVALLHDTRLSSDMRKSKDKLFRAELMPPSFISFDPPEHDRLRRLAMRHFGPPDRPEYIEKLRPQIEQITNELIHSLKEQNQKDQKTTFDVVQGVAGPLPVLMIATILGVPQDDQSKFKGWSDEIVDYATINSPEAQTKVEEARKNLTEYITSLTQLKRRNPEDDLISRMATDKGAEGQMEEPDLIATAILLLVAGHETTVNLITNGILTLLRHPTILMRLRQDPDLIVGTVEELLRYEPPVQLLARRTALDDITLGNATIPKGSLVTLALAAANRDPARFPNPDRFDPERTNNAHLGFGSGVHYCFGAPLARIEAQIVLLELAKRLVQPRLVQDPPPYRMSPTLRGPRELIIEIEGVH